MSLKKIFRDFVDSVSNGAITLKDAKKAAEASGVSIKTIDRVLEDTTDRIDRMFDGLNEKKARAKTIFIDTANEIFHEKREGYPLDYKSIVECLNRAVVESGKKVSALNSSDEKQAFAMVEAYVKVNVTDWYAGKTESMQNVIDVYAVNKGLRKQIMEKLNERATTKHPNAVPDYPLVFPY